MKKNENVIGFVLLAASIILGYLFIKKEVLFFRWLIGIGIGYLLTRSFFGFAGSVNRAYRAGSTKLMRVLMMMFVVTAILNAGFLAFGDVSTYRLSIHPINMGLVLGGLLFGFGMSLCSCCASGSLTDIVTGFPRGAITLFFMCMGVFVGFPFQARASWVKDSIIKSGTGKGVYLPDLFAKEGRGGYLGAVLLTVLFASIVIALSYMYERKRRNQNRFSPVGSEAAQDKPAEFDVKNYKLFNKETYEHIFSRPWTLATGAFAFTIIFGLLMGFAKTGWGVTTAFGFWFGKLLHLFGVSADSLASFTGRDAAFFTKSILSDGTSLQNIGIVAGTIICLLLAGTFKVTCKEELKISFQDAVVFAVGGFVMGVGTRLANGCNAGALFTPIAHFSLSGWLYLIFVTSGGILGNMFLRGIKRI